MRLNAHLAGGRPLNQRAGFGLSGGVVLLGVILWTANPLAPAAEPIQDVRSVASEMASELRKSNQDPEGRPLPVVSHWANGFNRPTFSSDYQIGLLERGHHVMPTLPFPQPGANHYPEEGRPWIEKLKQWQAPFSLRAGQWESVLYDQKHPVTEPGRWRNLPPEKTPLTLTPQGTVTNWISPWGAIEPWHEAGVYNTRSGAFRQLQEWYPEPPFVILLSNNEARRLKAKQDIAAISGRYLEAHGRNQPHEQLRRAMAEGYVERYRELLRGIREGLENETWRKNSKLVGYGAFGPPHFGRWSGWTDYSLTTRGRIDPWHLAWEGGSPSYYTHNWDASSDYRVHSPQVEANNWVFMIEEAYRERPEFWFEISIWDGNPSAQGKEKRKMDEYFKAGQQWSPDRYAGFVQYGLWLLRPRVVREFRGSTVPRAEFGQDFEALVAAVDRVWTNPVLRQFWRQSELVPNRARRHPYQTAIPDKWKNADRWFMLTTNLDPPEPWELTAELPVFALARLRGKADGREWLLYAHSPVKERKGVDITVPDFGKARVDVTPGGNFYLLKASDQSVKTADR